MENNSPFLNNYLFGEKIGSGGFSSVYKAIHLPTKIPVAIKMLTKQKFPIDKLRRELKIMELLDHPYTISLFEFIEDSNFFYIVMEYINGMSLYKLITNSGPLPEPTIKKYLVQVLSVLDYIHNDLHIAHRDIKPENIMIDENDNIRIIDFGLGNVFDSETFLKTACGSPAYAPPEMFHSQAYTTSGDIWSLGVVLYALSYGHLPFNDPNVNNLVQKIINDKPVFKPSISEELIDLLTKMLIKDPLQRITLPGIISHLWLSGVSLPKINSSMRMYPTTEFIPDNSIIDSFKEIIPDLNQCIKSMENHIFDENAAYYRIVKRTRIVASMKQKEALPSMTFQNHQVPKLSVTFHGGSISTRNPTFRMRPRRMSHIDGCNATIGPSALPALYANEEPVPLSKGKGRLVTQSAVAKHNMTIIQCACTGILNHSPIRHRERCFSNADCWKKEAESLQ